MRIQPIDRRYLPCENPVRHQHDYSRSDFCQPTLIANEVIPISTTPQDRDPSLLPQAIKLVNELRLVVETIHKSDPRKSWYASQLHSIALELAASDLSMRAVGARFAGLKQLAFLLDQLRCEDPRFKDTNLRRALPDSYRTVLARIPSVVIDVAEKYGCSIEPSLLHERVGNNDFDPVSPTAKVVAFLRSMDSKSDIHGWMTFMEEGWKILKAFGVDDQATLQRMSVLFLSRYEAINAIIAEDPQPTRQIIEFAAGISPRGYQWSKNVPNTIYVESDLPALMIRKAKMIRDICIERAEPHLGLHHCLAVDVLDRYSVVAAIKQLDHSLPFTIVTEGLLLYFDDREMDRFLTNMRMLLKEFPLATWVTDFVTQKDFGSLFAAANDVALCVKKIFSSVGRNVVRHNPFADADAVSEKLSEYDLTVQSQLPLGQFADLFQFEASEAFPSDSSILGNRMTWKVTAK